MASLSSLLSILAREPSRHGILDARPADAGAKGVMVASHATEHHPGLATQTPPCPDDASVYRLRPQRSEVPWANERSSS